MKNFYLLVVVLLLPGWGFSQAGSVPTVSKINNFAVGDTFEYHSWGTIYWPNLGGGSGYTMEIYFYRQNYGNDSVVYGCRSIQIDTCSCYPPISTDVDTGFYTIIALDSGIYYNITDTIDSTKISIVDKDTVYEEWDHFEDYNDCQGEDGGSDTTLGQNSTQYEAGLGEVYWGHNIQCRTSFMKLIYYHKANGEQSGTPIDFITGIKELSNNNTIQLFPNPASANFQLQFTAQPPDRAYLQIFDGLGQEVMEREVSSALTKINRGKLNNGIYFWQVMQGEEILQRGKLILQ